jgi:hypothetical protein
MLLQDQSSGSRRYSRCSRSLFRGCCLQAEVTVGELVRVVSKAMLLHLPVLVAQPGFAALWVAVLSALAAAAATGNETLSDAAAAALQNLLIMLHEMVSFDVLLFCSARWTCSGVFRCRG